jgi:hypothetical protein
MDGVERFQDLVTWQRMHELSLEIRKTAGHPPIASDYKFRGHLDALARRGLQALAKFLRYLRSEEARRNAKRARYARRSRPSFSNDSNDSND